MDSLHENYEENSNDNKERNEEPREDEDGEWVTLDNKQDEFDQEQEESITDKPNNDYIEMLPDIVKTPSKKIEVTFSGKKELSQFEPANETNRKRKLENDDIKSNNNSNKIKRNNYDRAIKQNVSNNKNNNENNFNRPFKLNINPNDRNIIKVNFLIPASAAGAINGRNCETLHQIERESGSKLKLERQDDQHPVENERLCVIEGNLKCALSACYTIYSKINSLHYTYDKVDKSRLSQVIFLVNDNTAGALIGPNGAYIKALRENTGVQIQISKNRTQLGDRTVVLNGQDESKFKALKMMFEKIQTVRDIKAENGNNDIKSNIIRNINNKNNINNFNQGLNLGNDIQPIINRNINIRKNNNNFNQGLELNQMQGHKQNELSFTGLTPLSELIAKCGGICQMSSEKLSQALLELGFKLQGVTEIMKSIELLMKYGIIHKNPDLINNQTSLFNMMGLTDLVGIDYNNNMPNQNNLMRNMVHPNINNVQNNLRNLISSNNIPNNNVQLPNLINNLNFPRNSNNVPNNIAILKMLLNERQ